MAQNSYLIVEKDELTPWWIEDWRGRKKVRGVRDKIWEGNIDIEYCISEY